MGDAPTRIFDGSTAIHNPVAYKLPLGAMRHSFEDGEQGTIRVKMPFRARVTRVRSIVTKALAATDSGGVTFSTTEGTLAVLTHPASAPVGQSRSTEIIDNAIIEAGRDLHIETDKTTEGGKISIDLDVERVAGP